MQRLSYEERLKELWPFSFEKKRLREDLSNVYILTWWERTREPDFSVAPITGQETVGTNSDTNSVWRGVNSFILWGLSNTGKSCPEKLWERQADLYTKKTLESHILPNSTYQSNRFRVFHAWKTNVCHTSSESSKSSQILQFSVVIVLHALKNICFISWNKSKYTVLFNFF